MDNLREQFSLIYDQYIDKIYRFIYVKVNSQPVAEDITSKVFMKGWESYQKGQNIKNPGAFLYQIARNNVIDHYRQNDRAKLVSSDSVAEAIDPQADVHESAVFNADIRAIKTAIGGLKQEYQDVLIFHYLEDMPTEQIADIMGKPAGTVRVMIHRGLKALKDNLVEEG